MPLTGERIADLPRGERIAEPPVAGFRLIPSDWVPKYPPYVQVAYYAYAGLRAAATSLARAAGSVRGVFKASAEPSSTAKFSATVAGLASGRMSGVEFSAAGVFEALARPFVWLGGTARLAATSQPVSTASAPIAAKFYALPLVLGPFKSASALSAKASAVSAAKFVAATALSATSEVKRTFHDNFNRPNGDPGEAFWLPQDPKFPSVSWNNRANAVNPPAAGVTQPCWMWWRQPLATDNQEVNCAVMNPASNGQDSLVSGLVLRKTPDDWRCVFVFFTNARIVMATMDATGKPTERVGKNVGIGEGNRIRFTAVGNTYVVTINDVEHLRWVDSGNAHPIGTLFRRVGFITQSYQNGFPWNSIVNSWALDDWNGRDI
ncbi:hypothetical protein [Nocardia sp. IFM 10818]